jgi:hypothetical protein
MEGGGMRLDMNASCADSGTPPSLIIDQNEETNNNSTDLEKYHIFPAIQQFLFLIV